MMGQGIGGGVGGAEDFDVEAVVQGARPEFGQLQLFVDLVVDGLGGLAVQLLCHAKHVDQFVGEPDAGGRAAKEVEVVGEYLPGLAVVCFHRLAILPGHGQVFQADALRIQHAEDVVVGDKQQRRGRTKTVVGVGEEARIDVAVGANQRQTGDSFVQRQGDALLGGVGGEEAVGW
jgi:hypothetical protein